MLWTFARRIATCIFTCQSAYYRCTFRRPDSSIYVDAKLRAAKATGMKTTLVDIPTEELAPADLEAKVGCLWTKCAYVQCHSNHDQLMYQSIRRYL